MLVRAVAVGKFTELVLESGLQKVSRIGEQR